MRKGLFIICVLWLTSLTTGAFAQKKKQTNVLPVQEKVYLHFDNNCYFLGDTIWYKAYVVLADDNTPQPLSKILYVELLNEQGYILERQQLVVDENGQANGQFAIADTTFAGYYEIRAYTKWMLNFGYERLVSWYGKSWVSSDEDRWYPVSDDELAAMVQQEIKVHPGSLNVLMDKEGNQLDHLEKSQREQEERDKPKTILGAVLIKDSEYDSNFSIDRDGMEKNYRLYNNLFSRVIPVYNRPDSAEHYMRKIMPTKITMGDFQVNWLTEKFDVKFYPEGGTLIEGFPCRVAWEAMNQELERLNVRGVLLEDGEEIDSLLPLHAGRGVFTFTPQHSKNYKARFVFGEKKFTFKLPEAERYGARLVVEQDEEGVYFNVAKHFKEDRPLLLMVLCRGQRMKSFGITGSKAEWDGAMYQEDLHEGVNQAVLTDADGNVFADRLFFVNRIDEAKAHVLVGGIPNRPYRPLEKIKLNLIATDSKGGPLKEQTFSVAVRDADQLDPSFSSGNVLTNLLLESEIKGFVETPDYYFEANDEKHQKALDLLLMIQGWRRYDWHYVISPSQFNLQYLPEQKMVIYGNAMPLRRALFTKDQGLLQITCRLFNTSNNLKKGDTYLFEGNIKADTAGYFQIPYEPFYGTARLSLRAKFVRKMEKKNYDKVEHDPKIFLRKQYYYPQGVKTYSWYETHTPENFKDRKLTWEEFQKDIYASEWIPQVNIKSKRRPHAKRQLKKYVYQTEYLDFLNDKWDQGYYDTFDLLGGLEYPSVGGVLVDGYVRHQYETQYNTREVHMGGTDWGNREFSFLATPKKIRVVSDAPRRHTPFEHYHLDRQEGSPTSGIDSYINIRMCQEDEERVMQGREYNLQGFTRPAEYYNPDYSKAKLPEIKDYRRTLYWNPKVTTDNYGQASIEFYNNSVCTTVDVSAEGVTKHGECLVAEE